MLGVVVVAPRENPKKANGVPAGMPKAASKRGDLVSGPVPCTSIPVITDVTVKLLKEPDSKVVWGTLNADTSPTIEMVLAAVSKFSEAERFASWFELVAVPDKSYTFVVPSIITVRESTGILVPTAFPPETTIVPPVPAPPVPKSIIIAALAEGTLISTPSNNMPAAQSILFNM